MMIPKNSEQILKTKSLNLEPILPAHAEKLYHLLQSNDLYTYIPTNPPKSVLALEERYLRALSRQSPDKKEVWLNYAIFHNTHQSYVGTLQATIQSKEITYIAYEVFPAFWKMGIAKEACQKLIEYLFLNYPIEKITAHLDTRNLASKKLLESLHFKCVRTIKDADEFKGSKSDEYVYELLNTNSL